MSESKQDVAVKVCPFCSSSEIAIGQTALDNKPKAMPKFVPMGCLGSACTFYNEDYKQCLFKVQAVFMLNMAGKYLDINKKGE